MKNLILVRHGKSSWKHNVSDDKRPLKARGQRDALLVAQQLKLDINTIDKVYSSHANRALSTCKIFLQVLKVPEKDLEITDKLYDFGGEKVTEFLKKLDDNQNLIFLFGHNNAFNSISNIFGDQYISHLPTSGLVWLTFDIDSWSELKKGITKLTIFPRDLK
ncbi:MAG: histidine phosphatase family protein [Bacteroidetes bacterium MedPE-SWsnd-G2]|nr:MAG: histidine phosphatase family protein [Bacteroidetes bacterium MedPE-SWsnd-G2]